MPHHLLLLGGTSEANALAARLADTGVTATYSYAGRVAAPRNPPLPMRVGGFGGPEGLAQYIRDEGVTAVVDATHPFAAQMSHNAVRACQDTGTPLLALSRAPWVAQAGDEWVHVERMAQAVDWLDRPRLRILLAIGRTQIDMFAAQPQHFYLLRVVDAPDSAPDKAPLPDCDWVVGAGPFGYEADLALLRDHRIDLIVSKNSGGTGARAKIDAARELGLPVLMIDRPEMPDRVELHDVEEALRWVHEGCDLGV